MPVGDKDWIDRGTYWQHIYDQLSKRWKDERYRFTASWFSAAANQTFYRGEEDAISHFTGVKVQRCVKDKIASNYGLVTEAVARDWYRSYFGRQVREVGLLVPKWDDRIGYSPDGEVEGDSNAANPIDREDGLVEIKCLLYVPPQLKKFIEAMQRGHTFPPGYHDHIFIAHYDQMQGGMAITGKKWCDYIVFVPNEEFCYVERFYFDEIYWVNHLYKSIRDFLHRHKSLFDRLKERSKQQHCDESYQQYQQIISY